MTLQIIVREQEETLPYLGKINDAMVRGLARYSPTARCDIDQKDIVYSTITMKDGSGVAVPVEGAYISDGPNLGGGKKTLLVEPIRDHEFRSRITEKLGSIGYVFFK